MRTKESDKTLTLTVPLSSSERARLDAICGPGKKEKRGQWVAEAIRRYLDEVDSRESKQGA